MIKKLVGLAVVGGLGAAGVFLYFALTGPRMRVQPMVKAYQAEMPRPPPLSLPIEEKPRLPSPEAAASLASPLQPTAEVVARGRVYYGYYCVFCHEDAGDGVGPVGESYVPLPPDLRDPKYLAYSDGQLLLAMLTGNGHQPVLASIVPPQHQWYLVAFTRSLASRGR